MRKMLATEIAWSDFFNGIAFDCITFDPFTN